MLEYQETIGLESIGLETCGLGEKRDLECGVLKLQKAIVYEHLVFKAIKPFASKYFSVQ